MRQSFLGTTDSKSVTCEFDVEHEDDTRELEMEWPEAESEEDAAVDISADAEDSVIESGPLPVAPVTSQSSARVGLFRNRGEAWRWRLRHRNGNVIATSGESYTRKHNAEKGLRSVMQNAPGAETVEESDQ